MPNIATHNFYSLFHKFNLIYILRYLYAWQFSNPIRIFFSHDIIDSNDKLFSMKKELGALDIHDFHRRIQYLLSRNFKFINLDTAINLLKNDPRERPSNCVLLTFDDGYESFYNRVYPILQKYNIPATVFLTTEVIRDTHLTKNPRNNKLLWYDQLIYAVVNTDSRQISLPNDPSRPWPLSTTTQKKVFIEHSCEILKKLKENQRKQVFKYLVNNLGFPDIEEQQNTSYGANIVSMLSWNEIIEMFRSGLVSFGSHTKSHPILTRISLSEVKQELLDSKSLIESKLHSEIISLAYPNGKTTDYSNTITNIAQSIGYQFGFTTTSVDNTNTDRMLIGRNPLDVQPFSYFTLTASGFNELVLHHLKSRYLARSSSMALSSSALLHTLPYIYS
jgi:peptidoglycan/xylan/chitin deacetylase (PgdA/CDA1 family)